MNFSSSIIIIITIVLFLVSSSLNFQAYSLVHSNNEDKLSTNKSQSVRPHEQVQKLRRIREHLKKINKTPVKTIQSVDGDLIDCVLTHQQPAFDNPMLRGRKPLDPPKRPKGYERAEKNNTSMIEQISQLWHMTGETCPPGSIPIRRTSEDDMMRVSSIARFGMKPRNKFLTEGKSSVNDGHEYAVGIATGKEYYGARAIINVWPPNVASEDEFSLSQIWVASGSFGDDDLNTIEAGWQVNPNIFGDHFTRLFIYWTRDAYKTTGCYNLLCSGFVQTNKRVAVGAAISPVSTYNGKQYDVPFLISKDFRTGSWWLQVGSETMGYWPANLFTHLRDRHASSVYFGGEIVNVADGGSHTTTQMGSGHFSDEGFENASYFRNLEVVDVNDHLVPLDSIKLVADHPNCYDIKGSISNADIWGIHFYYGGPGKNDRCP